MRNIAIPLLSQDNVQIAIIINIYKFTAVVSVKVRIKRSVQYLLRNPIPISSNT